MNISNEVEGYRMKCENCQSDVNDNMKFCPNCGTAVNNEVDTKKKRKNIIPGFRTNKRWKKIIAVIAYVYIVIATLGAMTPLDYGNETDKILQSVEGLVMSLFVFVIPMIVITNFMGIRDKLPLFKRHKLVSTIVASFILVNVLLLIEVFIVNAIGKNYSEEYYLDKQIATEEQEKQEALLAKKEAEKKAKEEAEAKAKEEAEAKKQAKEEAEKKAKEEAEAKAKEEAEAKQKAKEEAERKAKEEAEEAELAREEQIAKENPLSREYARWYARSNNLDIHNFTTERLVLDTFIESVDVSFEAAVFLNWDPITKKYGRTKEYSEMFYIGSMKENRPDGLGILYEPVYVKQSEEYLYVSENEGIIGEGETSMYLAPIYAGEFSEGRSDGFGYKYISAAKLAEGISEINYS